MRVDEKKILIVEDLNVSVCVQQSTKRILQSVSFDVGASEIVGLVGGSGSGKTTAAYAILRLLSYGLKMDDGEIIFEGEDLFSCSNKRMQSIRGKRIGLISQEPLEAFNPVFTVGDQIDEVICVHEKCALDAARKKTLELLDIVGLPDPDRAAKSYPHQLSGGMRQRAMIAQALSCDPQLIIADEPTSNLDVTLQARIMQLFSQLCKERQVSFLLISHDLGMVEHIAERIVVLSEGRVVERGLTADVIAAPQHKYTQQLLAALK
ncbi:ABC transporter ATP-binding protein [Candidatus Omnitrophota bacterium]